MTRPDWDEYFLGIAKAVAARSDCERSKVGAVVVKDRRIRATGYNGSPAGMPGCGSCPRRLADAVPGVSDYDSGPGRCVAIHAEANALLYCDRADLRGATLYITREPCYACEKLIQAAGITEVWWPERLLLVKHFSGYPQRVLLGLPPGGYGVNDPGLTDTPGSGDGGIRKENNDVPKNHPGSSGSLGGCSGCCSGSSR